jgi:hypothetical protein
MDLNQRGGSRPPLHRPSQPELQRAERATWGVAPAPSVKIRKFSAYKNAAKTLFGFVSLELPSGLVLNECKLMRGQAGSYWIAPPSIKLTDKDGIPRLDPHGKAVWSPIVEFKNRETRDRFNEQVIEALRLRHPEAFEDSGAQ